MALPKLRITVDIEVLHENVEKLQEELKDPLSEKVTLLHQLLLDAEYALHDWNNYGTPKFAIMHSDNHMEVFE